MPDPDKRVLVLLYPDCIVFEVMLALELLRPHYPVDAAYPGAGDHPDSSGLTVRPQLTYDEIDVDRYCCVVVPGGDPGAIMADGRVDRVLRRADARALPIGGISAGVLVLAKSGVLAGKRVTHSYRAPFAPKENEDFVASFWRGAQVVDPKQTVVRDGNVVTALANGFIEFALELAKMLELCGDERALLLRSYYRGSFEPTLFGRGEVQ